MRPRRSVRRRRAAGSDAGACVGRPGRRTSCGAAPAESPDRAEPGDRQDEQRDEHRHQQQTATTGRAAAAAATAPPTLADHPTRAARRRTRAVHRPGAVPESGARGGCWGDHSAPDVRTSGRRPRRRGRRTARCRPQPVGHRAHLVVAVHEPQRLGLGGAEEQPGQLVGAGPVGRLGRHGVRQRGDQGLGPLPGPAHAARQLGPQARAAPAPCPTGTASPALRARRRRMPGTGRRRAAPRARRSRRCPTPRARRHPRRGRARGRRAPGGRRGRAARCPGETSPCTTPRSCSRPSAEATGASTVTTSPGDRWPRARTSASSAPPSRCGITTATRPSGSGTQASTATTWALAAAGGHRGLAGRRLERPRRRRARP